MKNIEDDVFGNNLIKYRKLRGYSQEKLSELSGISRRMITYYETTPSNPPVKSVYFLAKALGISMYDLIDEEKNETVNLFKDADPRTLKKIMKITELSKKDKATIYNMIDALLDKD